MALIRCIIVLQVLQLIIAQDVTPQVKCSPELMKVTVPMGEHTSTYLDQMKDYIPCKPIMSENSATYYLNLSDPFICGVTRVVNKITGKKTFYHKIIVEDKEGGHETLTVGCSVIPKSLHSINRRSLEPLPLDFQEPEVVPITRVEEWHAPEPHLGVLVRQNGSRVSGQLTVMPGTPLSMEIFLDNSSAPVYGLFVNYMLVTDTGRQSETLILNGCSLDPFLFDNFFTDDGDVLKAQFRAFKFPENPYVQFKGTVTVCLKNCVFVQCSNGAKAYGRRRREIASGGANLYEVSFTAFIKVDMPTKLQPAEWSKNLSVANQKLELNPSPATVFEKTPNDKFILVNHSEPAVNTSFINNCNWILLLAGVLLIKLY